MGIYNGTQVHALWLCHAHTILLCQQASSIMITQDQADHLMKISKALDSKLSITFPLSGKSEQHKAHSKDGREEFLFDINRKGRIKLTKCTYQERYATSEVLLRLDVDGPPHCNPDGEWILCPHLHRYRESFGTKWAIPLPSDFTEPSDLTKTLREFLGYCNVQNVPDVQRGIL